MGAEGSVTLQLREAVQAPDAGQPIDGALTIGYPDPEILADMLGSLQAAGYTLFQSIFYHNFSISNFCTSINPQFTCKKKIIITIIIDFLLRSFCQVHIPKYYYSETTTTKTKSTSNS